jgi:hypothetical protein
MLRNDENLYIEWLADYLDSGGYLIPKKQPTPHDAHAQLHEQSPATGLVKAQCRLVMLLKLV